MRAPGIRPEGPHRPLRRRPGLRLLRLPPRPEDHLLPPARIQDVICRGADLFDMLPEEYTFQAIIAKLGAIPSSFSAVRLQGYLLQNVDKYRYLLPGNCKRESG
ncbi:uncharacterized protein M6B38_392575 [Iris pallida]|uniref:Uncharacterized protein n=1 Tax=Iris pallida TaxID=29817 RepID=A0AAX6FXY3_IRIPA|nr:uncharacterized protein M6B38_392575 [Iris pallida]